MSDSVIDTLVKSFGKLPGLGPKSARRLVLFLIQNRDAILNFSQLLNKTANEIVVCQECYNIDTHDPCSICTNKNRENSILCIVENVVDLWAIEKSNIYKGLYHVLGGTLSAIDGKGPNDINLSTITKRINSKGIDEVIIATNSTLEGETTGHYVSKVLKNIDNIKISRLANGIPIGAELDYMDKGTLELAIRSRRNF